MAKTEIIYGVNPVCEVLRSGRRACLGVYIADGKQDARLKEIQKLVARSKIPVKNVDRREIDLITDGKKHQGVAARVDPFPYSDTDDIINLALKDERGGFILVLDGITDPQNFGSIIRTAHLMGVHGIVIPKDNSSIITSTVVKAAAGATEYAMISQVVNIVRELEYFKKMGFWIGGAEGSDGESLYQYDFKGENIVIVLGSEGKGMRRLVRENCDYLISIPMEGKIDSYNAAVAGAIIISEISRQRRFLGHANSIPKRVETP